MLTHLPTFDPESKNLNAIIETPRGSRNKIDFDEQYNLFMAKGLLPAGSVFPYDFGFVPSTLGEDGDPLDVLVLMDEPTPVGCLVRVRVIGVIEAKQTEDGKTMRNDRLIAVAAHAHNHKDVRALKDLNTHLVDEIEHFFISYNAIRGKQFKPVARRGPSWALRLISAGVTAFKKKTRSGT